MIEVEQQQVPVAWNATDAVYPAHACVHELFEAQAEHTPNAIAIVFGDHHLTYRQLNQRANQLAHQLQSRGVGPETLVALCLDRSLEIMVAILAVFKAGGAYVPLDPAYPAERLAFMLADTQARVLITQPHIRTHRFNSTAEVLLLDGTWQSLGHESTANPVSSVTPDNLAYTIYTSGSTGQPKGVLIAHRGLCNLATVQALALGVPPDSRILQFASFGFDASLWDVTMALLTGATLYIAPVDARAPGGALSRLLREQQITIATLPPAVLAALSPDEVPALQTIVSTGEACTSEIVARWSGAGRRFFNGYGPTETTVGATIGECDGQDHRPSIGRPFANMQVYLLDQAMQPVPVGVPGEVYVGGVGVARGYLNQPALTAARFLPDPFGSRPGARLYKTGDLALYRLDGTLEFVDRVDRQVKIHGYRIELGEIEAVLAQHPAVRESAVLVREETPAGGHPAGDHPTKRLVAYVVQSDQESTQEQIAQWQDLSDETYRERSANHDPTLNFVGWNSSYDGLPLPEAAIRELVEHTTERILELRPERVLEIGCGTGMLLFRIAPHCREYWATDFSREALRYLEQQLERHSQPLPPITLLERAADNLTEIPAQRFDVVVINSVVQYFPSIDYLLHVIEGVLKLVRPGGRIFIGDVRNLELLSAFHTAVQLHRAPDTLSIKHLRQRIQKHLALEEELVVAPGFFYALQAHLPRISQVTTQIKPGRFHNEFTQFRYDVVLHVEEPQPQIVECPCLDWEHHLLTLDTLRQTLQARQPDRLLVRGLPNARLTETMRALDLLAYAEESATVGELRAAIQAVAADMEPDAIWSLSVELGYTASIMWTPGGSTYEVVFERPADRALVVAAPLASRLAAARVGESWSSYANRPRPRKITQQLVPELRRYMQERLPTHMVPSVVVVLDALPLTINGKVDRAALPAPDVTRPDLSNAFVAPRDAVELQLVQIWEEVLQLRPIGVDDNFFDLGGHSLLAVRLLSSIQEIFGQELPLSTLSHEATIAQLAAVLRRPSQPRLQSPLIRIQRGGEKRPLFCIHPVGGSVLSYADLARHLDPEQPIYGIHIADIADPATIPASIEELATNYIEIMRSVQPEGPYLLGGWSFGGLVAFEMARQLNARGQQVALLALMDTWAPLPGNVLADYSDEATPFSFFAKDLEHRFARRLPLLTDDELRLLDPDTRLRYLHKLVQLAADLAPDYSIEQIQQQIRIYQANLRAADAYQPKGTYPYQITLFQAKEPFSAHPPADTLGWDQLTAEPVALYSVPGNHLTMFSEPHIVVLAERLQHCLDQAHAHDLGFVPALSQAQSV
ncbi:MAG TPA: amino acid adenylation domain-containing protein [Herpetosiphonaceae bacterium]